VSTASALRRGRGRCLVVGYDGTAGSRAAAAWAARELGTTGRLVLVHGERPLHAPARADAALRDELGQAILDELMLDGAKELLDPRLTTELADEDPVTALLDAVERHRAGAIVLGAARHSRVRRALGLVSDEVVAHSPVPVVFVPAAVSARPDAPARPRRAQSPRGRNGSPKGQGSRSARRT
jgi:nucleotide-binding universal stress UspA family protein